jgi:hypothetical protein
MVEMSPVATIIQIAGGYCLPRSLHVVARLGVADALGESPCSVADIAASVGADPESLARVLRLLAAHGVFTLEGESVAHSPASRLLRSDHPQSLRAFAQMFGFPVFWETFGAMEHAVRTGQPAAAVVYPEGFWAYLEQRPNEGRIFNAAMAGKASGAVHGILNAYDFSRFGSFGDIGGGRGHLLRAILDAVPSATGVLFDLRHVIDDVASIASERLSLQAGDFFHDALPRCDCYLLMEIIHDWGDDESVAILRAVRQAAQPGATVLVIETIVPEHGGPDWSKMLDIHMLTLLGGKQRTRQEYIVLLEAAGFRFQREIDTGAGISIMEAEAE